MKHVKVSSVAPSYIELNWIYSVVPYLLAIILKFQKYTTNEKLDICFILILPSANHAMRNESNELESQYS